MEGNHDSGSRSVSRPHPYACGDTAEIQCFGSGRLFEREEKPDDLRAMARREVQVSESGILVPRLLRGYGGEKQEQD